MLQNLARDKNFDTVPSFGLKRGDEDMDLTYYQLKEFKKSLGSAAMLTAEYANCYGDCMFEMRSYISKDPKVFEIIRKQLAQAGVL